MNPRGRCLHSLRFAFITICIHYVLHSTVRLAFSLIIMPSKRTRSSSSTNSLSKRRKSDQTIAPFIMHTDRSSQIHQLVTTEPFWIRIPNEQFERSIVITANFEQSLGSVFLLHLHRSLHRSLLSQFKEVKMVWASKAIEHMTIYFNIPVWKRETCDWLAKNDLIYSTFKADFLQVKIHQIPEESLGVGRSAR